MAGLPRLKNKSSKLPSVDLSPDLFRQMFDASPLPICWVDRQAVVRQSNAAFVALIADVPVPEKGGRLSDFFSHTSCARWEESHDRVMAGELRRDRGLIEFDGHELHLDVRFSPLRADGEELVCLTVTSVYDDAPALDTGAALSQIMEDAAVGIVVVSLQGEVSYGNRAACRLLGYRKEELTGMHLEKIDVDHSVPGLRTKMRALEAAGHDPVFVTRHRRKDGSHYHAEVSINTDRSKDSDFVVALFRDVSRSRDQERQMEELRFALENAADAIYLYDKEGHIRYANQAACDILGYSKQELLSMKTGELDPLFSEAGPSGLWLDDFMLSAKPLQTRHYKKDGTYYPVEVVISASNIGGEEFGVAFVRDISERLRAQQALEEGEERFRIIADTSPVALVIYRDTDGAIQYANTQAEALFRRHLEQLNGITFDNLLRESGVKENVIHRLTAGEDLVNHELLLDRDEDALIWVSVNTRSIDLQGERVTCCALLDVTEAKELSTQLTYHATYDDLTGLVNRREFEDRLQEVIELARRNSTENALCYLDLDQFKVINDTCGHMAGDELLRQIAPVLYDSVRHDDTLARLGGDEFAILLEHCSLEHAEKVAHQVRQNVQDFRFLWQGKNFNISVSIGLVPISPEAETISDVMRRADTACYAAKDAGRNRIHIFRFDDQELAQRHGEMQWVTRISAALDNDRLELWKQSIAPASGPGPDTNHFELLVRMRDEEGELIMPGAFLPSAERYDLVSRIDRWVMNATFDWLDANPAQVEKLACCAINLSGQTLSDAEFLEAVTLRFHQTGVPPQKICFEITETAAIANLTNATRFMRSLKSLGCNFALDDFGSGLSSFAYLKNLPVDYVKIDGFFVKDVTSDPVDKAMVKAINDMAHAMGKRTIAEFVEDDRILKIMEELGVDYVQGYGIARPEPL